MDGNEKPGDKTRFKKNVALIYPSQRTEEKQKKETGLR